ncbi:carboxypeptidase regulatory-like domain-containing protein [Oleiharenicola lentus]|uniref:TonB-dependent receptor n=1 Tax=Oleiharenicola lentus TaxID=2508720 RepID=UPI003F665530
MTIHPPFLNHSTARFMPGRFLSWLTRAVMLCAVFAAPALSFAQSTGTITGKVIQPSTGEYVRYAEVRIVGTNLRTETDREGVYKFSDVPAGTANVVVTYTGYETASSNVTVAAGETASQDFNLYLANQRAEDGTVQLDKFVVSSEVEGQAKAIQNQRRSTTIGDHVSSDEFGDSADGNVGEFLKHLPGVDLEYVQFDARGPRMRGMDPQYVGVTMDGIKLASADAFNATVGTDNTGIEGSRAFGFESISLSSIDSVEVFKNLSADLDADAPAGTINLRSKRAFDRPHRRIGYTFGLSANSEEFHFDKTPGPRSGESYKILPNVSFEYSDVFLNRSLGFVLTYNRSSVYNEFMQYAMSTVNRTTTATDPRPAVPQTITYTDGPKVTDRETVSFRVDYKLSPKFSFGVNTTFAKYHATFDNRQFRFVTSTANSSPSRATVLGEDPMVSFTSSASASTLTLTGDGADKFTDTISVMPSFDWKPTNNLTIEGRFGWSESDNQYRAASEGKVRSASVDALAGIQYTARRSSIDSGDWVFTQISGPDWGDAANYKNPRIVEEGRSEINEVYSGGIDATWKKPVFGLPAFLKFGVKGREEYRKFQDSRPYLGYLYVGPGGGTTGSFGAFPTRAPIDLSSIDTYFGNPPAFADRALIADVYNKNPEYFVSNPAAQTAANYYSAYIGNNRNIYERVDAAYLMGNVRIKKLQLQAGLRFEKTTDELLQPQQRPRAEVIAAGFAVDGTGRASTIPGLNYQFLTLPNITKVTDYDHLFASAALKYEILPNLDFQLGAHESINRPPLTIIAGVTTFNETTLVITAPNPGLLPEESLNVSAKLTYYLPTSGTLSAGVFQIDIDNQRDTLDRLPGTWFDEFPEIDPVIYGGYTVRSTVNADRSRQSSGMELEYRQVLSFLPGFLRNTSVYTNYTRAYTDTRRGGVAPHQINFGGSMRYKRFSFGGSAIWTDDTPWTNTVGSIRFRGARTRTDINASLLINKWVTLSVGGRDVGNVGQELYEERNGVKELVQKDIYGALWTFSVKGTF